MVTFRKTTGTYFYWKFNDGNLTILGSFLIDILHDCLLKHIDTPACDCEEEPDTLACRCNEIRGNSTYINFIKNNQVIVGLQFSEDNPQEIILDRDNLKDIVKKWQVLKNANIDEIAITRNKNNKVFIIGRSLTDEEKLKQKQSIEIWRNAPPELKNDRQYYNEFQKKWRSFTLEEIQQIEHEFYIATMETVS